MLRSASNPDSQKVDVVVGQLSQRRQQSVVDTLRSVSFVFGTATTRGRQGLMQMDAAEWDRLVEDANSG